MLDQRDRELLQQHAAMRKKRGWRHGFEQTFLVEDSIENAAAKGIEAQALSERGFEPPTPWSRKRD